MMAAMSRMAGFCLDASVILLRLSRSLLASCSYRQSSRLCARVFVFVV